MNDNGITDCIVVGGGLLGLLSARTLRHAGAAVTLLERGSTCREASWAGGGILSPLVPWNYPAAVSDLVRWSQRYYPGLARELQDETGIDIEWVQCGLLMPGVSDAPDIRTWAETHQCRLQGIDAVQLHTLEPSLAVCPGRSILLPDVAQIRNPRLCRALISSLREQGVGIHEQTEVTGLVERSGKILGVKTVQGDFSAGQVVIAGGAWSSLLLRGTGLDLPVEPVRGQMIQFQAPPGLLKHIVLYQDHYLIPRLDGLILAGSTLEYVGYDKSTTDEAHDLLARQAVKQLPALSGYEVVRHWAGLRPGSPDGIPIIDEHPDIKGLFINTGHFRNGVVMAPASARLLVDRMQKRGSFTGYEPYMLDK